MDHRREKLKTCFSTGNKEKSYLMRKRTLSSYKNTLCVHLVYPSASNTGCLNQTVSTRQGTTKAFKANCDILLSKLVDIEILPVYNWMD